MSAQKKRTLTLLMAVKQFLIKTKLPKQKKITRKMLVAVVKIKLFSIMFLLKVKKSTPSQMKKCVSHAHWIQKMELFPTEALFMFVAATNVLLEFGGLINIVQFVIEKLQMYKKFSTIKRQHIFVCCWKKICSQVFSLFKKIKRRDVVL